MGVWLEKAPMPTNRHDLQAIAVAGEIYAISGAGDYTVHAVEIYDVESDTWRPGPPIPTQRGWFGAARIGDEVYVCGGKRVRSDEEKQQTGDPYHFEIRDSVEVLDLKTQTWSATTPLSKPRAGLVAVACKGQIYAVGGNSMNAEPEIGQRHLDRVEVFDPATARWTLGVPLPKAVQGPGVAVVQDKIYVATGIGEDGPRPDFHVFDPETNHWSPLPPIPTPRCDPGCVAVGRAIYVFGGWGGSAPYHTAVEVYDIDAGTWSSETPMPTKKAWMATANVGERIFVMGGAHKWENREGYNWIADLHEYVP